MYLFDQLEYILNNSNIFLNEKVIFFTLRREFNKLGVVIDHQTASEIFQLINLYKQIDESYTNPESLNDFLKATKKSVLRGKKEDFKNFPTFFKEFYDLYSKLSKVLRKRTSVISSLKLPINLLDIIIKYDFHIEGKEQFVLEGHDKGIDCVAIFPDGRIVSGSIDKMVRVWDSNTGNNLYILQGEHHSYVSHVDILLDGRIVSGSTGILQIWDLSSWENFAIPIKFSALVLKVLPDGRIIYDSYDMNERFILRILDPNTRENLLILKGHHDFISCVDVLPDGRIISGSYDRTLRIWDPYTGENLVTLEGHVKGISCVAILPDGRIVSGSWDGTLRVWDPNTGKCLLILQEHVDNISDITTFPDGRIVSASNDTTLRVWDSNTGKSLVTLEGHQYSVNCVAILPDGRIVSGSWDKTLRIWDSYTGECLYILKGHRSDISCLDILPDGRIVSGSRDNTLRVWK